MRRAVLRIFLPMLLLAVLLIMAGCANRVPSLPVPQGVSKHTEKLVLQGKSVPVDFYLPQKVGEAPVVIVAHGFTRHRRVMAGWGNLLATQGMIAVVPNLPAFADHERNARAISELIALVHKPGRLVKAKPNGAVALVGHSAGGFATLLAATREKDVHCWIGLDPVDFGDHGLRAVQALKTPALMLLAESGAWNRHANALPWLNASASPLIVLRVRGSTHCDAENPTSRLAEIACGTTDATRRAVYERHTLAMLRQYLFGDVTATRALAHDPAVVPLPSRRADSTAKVE